MTTAEMKNIKLGDHVMYVAADREYNAMALGAPTEGYNSGAKLGSLFLNLIYLNEQAVPVKILAAALVGSAADDEHVTAIATAAAQHDPGWKEAGKTEGEREKIVAANVEFVKANPRTIGWKPEEISQASSATSHLLSGYLMQPLIELSTIVSEIDSSLDISPEGTLISAGQLLRGLSARLADLTLLAEAQQAALNQKPTEAPPQPDAESHSEADGKPSAADSDTVSTLVQHFAEVTGEKEVVFEGEDLKDTDAGSPVEGEPVADAPQNEAAPAPEA